MIGLLVAGPALLPTARNAPVRAHAPRRAVQPTCVAATAEEKALLAASKKVTLAAKKFGPTQGKVAQDWVEEAISAGGKSGDELMAMQLALFEECSLDDESGRCKDLSEAIEALTSAVADRKANPRSDEFDFAFASGATPIQEAATKLRSAATLFGPEQKSAADVWIKKITSGAETSGAGLLEEQVVLFGECVLSEGSTPSNCQQLETALAELQSAIETCNVDTPEACSEEAVVEEIQDASKKDFFKEEAAKEQAVVSGRKRAAVKRFFRKLTGRSKMSALQVASFLASPGDVGAEYEGKTQDELVAMLKDEGADDATISHAIVNVLPFLPGQEAPGIDSIERP